MSDNVTLSIPDNPALDPLGRTHAQIWFEVSLAILVCLVAFTGRNCNILVESISVLLLRNFYKQTKRLKKDRNQSNSKQDHKKVENNTNTMLSVTCRRNPLARPGTNRELQWGDNL